MPRKPDTISFWRGRLSHWEVAGGRYFITIHLAGAIPREGQDRIHALSAEYEKLPDHDIDERLKLDRRIYAEMESWLDRADDVAYLARPDIAQIIVESIKFRQGREWNVFEFVVMPSHLHIFLEVTGEVQIRRSLEQFKRWTGHEAAKLLTLNGGHFWQDEWFDHWSRSNEEDEKILRYIRNNPVKAHLVEDFHDWPFGSW